jgi:hypothetical protein
VFRVNHTPVLNAVSSMPRDRFDIVMEHNVESSTEIACVVRGVMYVFRGISCLCEKLCLFVSERAIRLRGFGGKEYTLFILTLLLLQFCKLGRIGLSRIKNKRS